MPLSEIIKLVYLYVAKVRCLNVYMSAKESVKNLMNDEIEMRLLLRVSPSYGLERRVLEANKYSRSVVCTTNDYINKIST